MVGHILLSDYMDLSKEGRDRPSCYFANDTVDNLCVGHVRVCAQPRNGVGVSKANDSKDLERTEQRRDERTKQTERQVGERVWVLLRSTANETVPGRLGRRDRL